MAIRATFSDGFMRPHILRVAALCVALAACSGRGPALTVAADQPLPDGSRSACGGRYERAAPVEVRADATPLVSIRRAFRASRVWGVAENVRLVAEAAHPQPALAVRYPKGSIAPSSAAPRGGAGFVSSSGLEGGVDAACLSYRLRFAEGFAFAKGGKLPGLFGGDGPVGGAAADAGFSTRLMWREGGQGELYAYLPDRGVAHGLSLGRGAWRFPVGRWVEVEQEVVLNDPGSANGVARIWIGGELRLEEPGLVFRHAADVRIEGLMFSTFFGGRDPAWASPRDQEALFADFAIHLPADTGWTTARVTREAGEARSPQTGSRSLVTTALPKRTGEGRRSRQRS